MAAHEAQYRTANGRIFFKIEAGSQKELFEKIAKTQEIFEADDKCGCCGSPNIRFRVREVTKGKQEFRYFELACLACYARLEFGQSQDMQNLFPKRKDSDGNYLPNRGWAKYQKQTNQEEQQ